MDLLKKEIQPGIHVVEFSGSIHAGRECERIETAVEEHIKGNQTRLIFDFTRVSYIDSPVIGMIVKAHSRLRKSGGGLRLAAVPGGMVEKVLMLTRLHKVISLHGNTTEASVDFVPESAVKWPEIYDE